MRLTGQDGTDLHRVTTLLVQNLHNCCRTLRGAHMVCLDHSLTGIRIHDGLSDITTCDTLLKTLDALLAICKCLDLHVRDCLAFTAVNLTDNQILGDIYQTSGQVTRVSGTKSRIGQSLTSSVCRDEVLQYVKTLTEVGLDRKFDCVTGCICHQASHTSQLFDLLIRSSSSGVSHHVDVVVLIQTA